MGGQTLPGLTLKKRPPAKLALLSAERGALCPWPAQPREEKMPCAA